MFGNLFGDKNEAILGKTKSDCSRYEWDVVKSIQKHGFFFTYVSEDGHSSSDSFSFTTGLWKTLNFPEIITFGLPREACAALFSDVFDQIKNGVDLSFDQHLHHMGNLPIVLTPARRETNNAYLLTAKWFYETDDFPVIQLLWPDPEGRFPWEARFDPRFADHQPDMTVKGFEALSSIVAKDTSAE